MIFQYNDYRDYLNNILVDRKERNDSYSLRALARALGVPASTLSEVLRKNKNLSGESAQKICERLQFKREEGRFFKLLVEKESQKKNSSRYKEILAELKSLAQQAQRKKVEGPADEPLLSSAAKFVLIELGDIPGFKLTAESGAQALAISTTETAEILKELETRGVMRFDPNQQCYTKTGTGVVVSADEVNLHLRRFHLEMLDRAKNSLSEQPPAERFVGSETFSFDSTQLAAANELIEDFFAKMVALANSQPKKDSVYHVGVQMFRLTQAGTVVCKES